MGGKKIWRIGLVLLVVLTTTAAIIYLRTPKEPRYQGRTLSDWIGKGLNSYRSVPGDASWQTASNAVCQIGTNAIPFLLRWATVKDSKAKAAVISRINSYLPFRFHVRTDVQRHREAILGFQCLGPIAKPAWPIFVQWTRENNPDIQLIGLNCLIATTADKETLMAVVRRLVKDPNGDVQARASLSFHLLYPQEATAEGIDDMFPWLKGYPALDGNDARRLIFQ